MQNEYISRHTADSITDKLKSVKLHSAAKCDMVITIKCGGQLTDHNKSKKNDWFNNNCRRKGKFFIIAITNCRFDMNDNNLRNLKLTAKEYKMEIRKAKSIYQKSVVLNLDQADLMTRIHFDDD